MFAGERRVRRASSSIFDCATFNFDLSYRCMSILLEQALRLPIPERRKLADDIYDSIDPVPREFFLTDDQKAELDRRMEEHRKHPETAVPWETVRDNLRKRA